MYKSYFFLILFLSIYLAQSEDSGISCTLSEDCKNCEFCGNLTKEYMSCKFENSFCHHVDKGNYEYNTQIKNAYSNYFRSKSEISSFCGEREIDLNSMKDSFIILNSNSYKKSDNLYHCDYKIINSYYLEHNSDIAIMNFEIKSSSNFVEANKRIKFNLFVIYTISNSIRFYNLTDNDLRNNYINRTLSKISEAEILIDFRNTNENTESIEEILEISIITENSSKKTRIIIIIVLVICGFLILLIIVLIILYIIIKRKMEIMSRERRDNDLVEREEKIKQNTILVNKLLENELKPKIFTKDLVVNDCENCTICLEPFECGKSEVSITACNHIFHFECLKNWMNTEILNPQCPNCKYGFLSNSIPPKDSPENVLNINTRNNNNNGMSDNLNNHNEGSSERNINGNVNGSNSNNNNN